MKICQVYENKKAYLELLLLGDEQESMIDRYLERGDMFILRSDKGDVRAECVIVREKAGIYELKNIAVDPKYQRRGYGRELIARIFQEYPDCEALYAGTGDSKRTLSFYKSCGFTEVWRVPDFFIRHYDHPIYEDGIQLRDMIYLKKERGTCGENIQEADRSGISNL